MRPISGFVAPRAGHGVPMVANVRARLAIIPAAGLGTRFLPLTKVIPKELLPMGEVPGLQVVVEEAVDAGIETVIVVNHPSKSASSSTSESTSTSASSDSSSTKSDSAASSSTTASSSSSKATGSSD